MPAKPKKRILILTVDAGFGHRSASRAVVQALDELHPGQCECTTVNPLSDPRTPFFIRNSARGYDDTVRGSRGFYGLTYAVSLLPVVRSIVANGTAFFLSRTLRAILAETQPDAILSTYHLYHASLQTVLKKAQPAPPVLTVVTDLGGVHGLWFHPGPRTFFVANEAVRDEALAARIAPDQVVVSGIPVDPRIHREQRDQATIRKELLWQPARATVLMVGSRRVGNMREATDAVNNSGLPVQLAVVAGGDDLLYAELQRTQWQVPARIYNYVDNIPTMLRAADILVSKAGGLIVAEGLAAGLPLILIDAIPGQEVGNIRYACDNGAALLAATPLELVRTITRWLADGGAELRRVAANAARLGKPTAAYEVADAIWRAANSE